MKKGMSGLGKKAIFFTMSSVLIVSLFLMYYSTRQDLSVKEKAEISESRVTAVNNFAQNLEQIYLPRALYTSTNKAIDEITLYLISKGRYTNMTVNFPQVVVNGTFCDFYEDPSCSSNVTLPGMEVGDKDYRLGAWLAELTNISREEMNIHAQFNITHIYINQTNPWSLDVTLNLDYNISSPEVVSIIGRDVRVTSVIGIEGYVDPLIAIETGGAVIRKINRSNINLDIEKGSAVVAKVVAEKNYVYQNRTAPSFLMRFEKNLNRSECCGIESLVTKDILAVSPEQGHRSYADFQFWMEDPSLLCMRDETTEDNQLYNVSGVSREDDPETAEDEEYLFKLDRAHMDKVYGVQRTTLNTMDITCIII